MEFEAIDDRAATGMMRRADQQASVLGDVRSASRATYAVLAALG
jgi:hypothetical protein